MGYYLHITRKENWFEENPEKEISFEEWKMVCMNDEELKSEPVETKRFPDRPPEREEYLVVSHSHKFEPAGEVTVSLLYYTGSEIACKGPLDETIRKMITLAGQLKARVVGDDGEVYSLDANDEIVTHQKKVSEGETGINSKPWWKFW